MKKLKLLNRRRLFAAGLLAAPFIRPARAAPWAPSQPVRLVVPYPAGGPTDVIARIVAADIAGPLGQQVVVENMSGASGAIGTRVVAKAKPDGLTIVFGNNQTHGNNMFMLREPGYDAVKDLARSPVPAPSSMSSWCARTCRRSRSRTSSSSPRRSPGR